MEHLRYEETATGYTLPDFPQGLDESVPLDFSTPYGCAKGAADHCVRDWRRVYGLKIVVFRHSSIFGGGNPARRRSHPGVLLQMSHCKPVSENPSLRRRFSCRFSLVREVKSVVSRSRIPRHASYVRTDEHVKPAFDLPSGYRDPCLRPSFPRNPFSPALRTAL